MNSHTLLTLGLLLTSFPALAADTKPTRIVIQGTDVVDGWVSTNSTASFSDKVLRAGGRAWDSYDYVLLRFRMSSIDPTQFARVKKAVLRLNVQSAENPAKKVTTVAPSSIAWTTRATTASPNGNKLRWPSRNSFPNINYGMIESLKTKRLIQKSGVVEFDITQTVNRWLYQGLANHGLIVTASPPIFGKPNQGSWSLSFASSKAKGDKRPALVVDMEGTPPSPSQVRQRALALYPSASMVPIKNPYYFVYYNVGSREMWQKLKTINMTTYSSHGDWLSHRGVMNLAWAEGGPVGWLPDRTAYATYYSGTARQNPLGLCGHESNLKGGQAPWLVNAFSEAHRHFPDRFLAYYYRGEAHMAKAAGEGHIDLLIQEGYTSVHKQFPIKGFAIGFDGVKRRIDTARKHNAVHRQIVMLGHICKPGDYHPKHELTANVLDKMIAELRAYAPEMPGIGFYGVNGKKLATECDRLARKHFVEPAPEVTITEPRFEQTLTTTHVSVRATALPKNKRKVSLYRWFVDNRYVAETKKPEYLWDLRGENNGPHTVTVHAIDDGWNRAASQIPVKVSRPSFK